MVDDSIRAREDRKKRTKQIRDRFLLSASEHASHWFPQGEGVQDTSAGRPFSAAALRESTLTSKAQIRTEHRPEKPRTRRRRVTLFSSASRTRTFALLLAFRVYNAFVVRTFYVPDEYWQSLEVAHRLVFGYGHLTWEWREGIRGYAHPLIFAAGYKLLQIFGLDGTELIIYVPLLTQAAFAAVGDWHVYALALQLSRDCRIAKYTLVLQLTSWWNWFCSTRALANSNEASLTAVALSYWPWNASRTDIGAEDEKLCTLSIAEYRCALFWAATACILRPTNAFIWVYLGTDLLLRCPGRRVEIVTSTGFIAFLAVLTMTLIDRALYGQWVFTPLKFITFNVSRGLSAFYGSHAWHWYITQGLPLVGFLAMPLFAVGAVHDSRARSMAWLVAWVVTFYSLVGHKEFRFLYSVLPVVMAGGGFGMQRVLEFKGKKRRAITLGALGALAAANFLLAFYATCIHQRGVLDVVHYLRRETRRKTTTTPVWSVGFMMPCHSTPFYSHVHKNIPMWFLTCEPPLSSHIQDDADKFYQDPPKFVLERFDPLPSSNPFQSPVLETSAAMPQGAQFGWPSHLVVFDALNRQAPSLFANSTYRECARFFNSHFHEDWRRKGDVMVYCRSPETT